MKLNLHARSSFFFRFLLCFRRVVRECNWGWKRHGVIQRLLEGEMRVKTIKLFINNVRGENGRGWKLIVNYNVKLSTASYFTRIITTTLLRRYKTLSFYCSLESYIYIATQPRRITMHRSDKTATTTFINDSGTDFSLELVYDDETNDCRTIQFHSCCSMG